MPFTRNGINITTHTDIAGGPNLVTDIALFSMHTGANTEVGIGFYDNYKVAIVVPEPATARLFVLGAATGCGKLLLSRPSRPKSRSA